MPRWWCSNQSYVCNGGGKAIVSGLWRLPPQPPPAGPVAVNSEAVSLDQSLQHIFWYMGIGRNFWQYLRLAIHTHEQPNSRNSTQRLQWHRQRRYTSRCGEDGNSHQLDNGWKANRQFLLPTLQERRPATINIIKTRCMLTSNLVSQNP